MKLAVPVSRLQNTSKVFENSLWLKYFNMRGRIRREGRGLARNCIMRRLKNLCPSKRIGEIRKKITKLTGHVALMGPMRKFIHYSTKFEPNLLIPFGNFSKSSCCMPECQCTYKRNIDASSRNHFCCGKAVSIWYYDCVSVTLIIQKAQRMRHIILPVACPILSYFFTLPHKRRDF